MPTAAACGRRCAARAAGGDGVGAVEAAYSDNFQNYSLLASANGPMVSGVYPARQIYGRGDAVVGRDYNPISSGVVVFKSQARPSVGPSACWAGRPPPLPSECRF